MRLTLDEYSKRFKMSKEMINSKLRTKKLNYIIDNGVTYVIAPKSSIRSQEIPKPIQEEAVAKPIKAPSLKQKTTVATVLSLYQRENKQLKEKIIQLESKIDKLIDDKEQMLRDERDKIERLYSTKDEQLKNILELINAKLTLQRESTTIHEVESFHAQDEKRLNEEKESQIIELREYLKNLDVKSAQKKTIKKRFLSVYDSDVRITQQNGKLYLDFSKYDYSDLLEY